MKKSHGIVKKKTTKNLNLGEKKSPHRVKKSQKFKFR